MFALASCGGGAAGTGGAAPTSTGPAPSTTDTGSECADTVELVLVAERSPVDATFVARGGGAYVDPNGELRVIFGDRPFALLAEPPDDLVTVAVNVPLDGTEPRETTYTSAADDVTLDVTRRDAEGSISSSFGLEGTGDEISLEITEIGDGFLCADVIAASNPTAGSVTLALSGTIEVPFGDFEDL